MVLDNINAQISKEMEASGTPDVLVVFRNAVPVEYRDQILNAVGGNLRESFQTAKEEIWALNSDPNTFAVLEHLNTTGHYYGLSMKFNGKKDDNFGLYMPKDGGLPLSAKHVLIIEAPTPKA